jgi:hypothetical protein
MTDNLETLPYLSDNEEQGNLSELSLSSAEEVNPPPEEEEIVNETLPTELDEVLHIDESQREKEDDLTQFITKARQQDYNCLDLSKKNIVEFPETLLEFPSLQVISFHTKLSSSTYFVLVFVFRRQSNQSITR